MVEDEVVKLLSSTTLEDYKKLATLGMGGFGRVELVRGREREGEGEVLSLQHVVYRYSTRTILTGRLLSSVSVSVTW